MRGASGGSLYAASRTGAASVRAFRSAELSADAVDEDVERCELEVTRRRAAKALSRAGGGDVRWVVRRSRSRTRDRAVAVVVLSAHRQVVQPGVGDGDAVIIETRVGKHLQVALQQPRRLADGLDLRDETRVAGHGVRDIHVQSAEAILPGAEVRRWHFDRREQRVEQER